MAQTVVKGILAPVSAGKELCGEGGKVSLGSPLSFLSVAVMFFSLRGGPRHFIYRNYFRKIFLHQLPFCLLPCTVMYLKTGGGLQGL